MRAGDATIASVLAQANQRQELTGQWVGSEFVWISEVHAKELPKGGNAALIVRIDNRFPAYLHSALTASPGEGLVDLSRSVQLIVPFVFQGDGSASSLYAANATE